MSKPKINIAGLREEYMRESLDEQDVARDPIAQFNRWFDEAVAANMPMVNSMSLATVGADGGPSARIVLLKGVDARGFVFYTNYASRKGADLAAHPVAALLFHWVELEREVRIEGRVEKVTAAESDDYFASRPLGSRHAAIASPQSEVVTNRAALEALFADAEKSQGPTPKRPPHWGGYRVLPTALEFWQGRPNRLHDRVLYSRVGDAWKIERLAP
ncbi:MAG: pyridoxamine 5-phosphate oxidase [Betaproteobacteria bacterium]|nr:pyridoxamine 5-phosphate oxidase [Betaproteobacteria bacterium]